MGQTMQNRHDRKEDPKLDWTGSVDPVTQQTPLTIKCTVCFTDRLMQQ